MSVSYCSRDQRNMSLLIPHKTRARATSKTTHTTTTPPPNYDSVMWTTCAKKKMVIWPLANINIKHTQNIHRRTPFRTFSASIFAARLFFVPCMVRVLHLSDTLAVSSFTAEKRGDSVQSAPTAADSPPPPSNQTILNTCEYRHNKISTSTSLRVRPCEKRHKNVCAQHAIAYVLPSCWMATCYGLVPPETAVNENAISGMSGGEHVVVCKRQSHSRHKAT